MSETKWCLRADCNAIRRERDLYAGENGSLLRLVAVILERTDNGRLTPKQHREYLRWLKEHQDVAQAIGRVDSMAPLTPRVQDQSKEQE